MFFIKTIRLSKKYSNENKIILLFDATISDKFGKKIRHIIHAILKFHNFILC